MSVHRLTVSGDHPTAHFPDRPAICGQAWVGNVVDPKPLYPRTVSMTWVDPCDMEVRASAASIRCFFAPLNGM